MEMLFCWRSAQLSCFVFVSDIVTPTVCNGYTQAVKGSARQGWVVDCAPTYLQNGPKNGGVISTPPIKLLSLASLSRHLDSNQKEGV